MEMEKHGGVIRSVFLKKPKRKRIMPLVRSVEGPKKPHDLQRAITRSSITRLEKFEAPQIWPNRLKRSSYI
jgi:hypothetical protein